MKHPMQPIEFTKDGVIRFKQNRIIQWLFESGKLDLNQIAIMPFSDEDRIQLAQLLGYSVDGFGDLSYVDRKTIERADFIADRLVAKRAKKL